MGEKRTGKTLPWYVDNCPEGGYWLLNPVMTIKGTGGVNYKKSIEMGITTAQQIKSNIDADFLTVNESTVGISLAKLTEWRDCEENQGICPHVLVDYHTVRNLYEDRYGAGWLEECGKIAFMQKYMCITELMDYIHDHSKKYFKGTTHEDGWYFYHDALKQLIWKSTVRWMQEKGYYNRWIIPQL